MNLTDLHSFVRVVELGTIAAAAAEAGVPRSTITRRITRLERALDTELLRRAARSFTVTDDGRQLHRLSVAALRELEAAERVFGGSDGEPRGTLVLSAPDIVRNEAFAELLVAYRHQNPKVTLEMRVENRLVDLVHEGVDICIRAHAKTIPGPADLMVRTYELPPMGFFASPAYLRDAGTPNAVEELTAHALVLHTAGVGVPKTLLCGEEQKTIDLGTPAFRANDTPMVRELTEASAGIGMLPHNLAARSLQRGSLVAVLPAWRLQTGRIGVVWPSSRHLAPRVRAFLDLLHTHYG